MAARLGLSVPQLVLRWLRLQHTSRASDHALLALLPAADRPKRYRWKADRLAMTAPTRVRDIRPLELVPELSTTRRAAATGLARLRYVALGAAVCCVPALLTMIGLRVAASESLHQNAAPLPVILGGDAVNAAAPGMPSNGEVWSFYARRLSPSQSPVIGVAPLAVMCGSDGTTRLCRWLAEWGAVRHVQTISQCVLGRRPVIVVGYHGDFPAVYAFTAMERANRALPTTPGRVRAWCEPICWCCGGAPSEIYRYLSVCLPRLRPSYISPAIGLSMTKLFYAPVHAVTQTATALLADIAICYQIVGQRAGGLHPVAGLACSFFPLSQFDPFKVTTYARATSRKSNKPLIHVDPAVLWTWLRSVEHQSEWLASLELYPLSWLSHAESYDVKAPFSAASLWACLLAWFHSYATADHDTVAQAARRVNVAWLEMLSLAKPMQQPALACAPDQRPDTDPRFCAYGPASHAALCGSAWACRILSGVCGVAKGESLFPYIAEIYLEHAQKFIAAVYSSFEVGRSPRALRSRGILIRLIERAVLAGLDFLPADSDNDDQSGTKRARADGEPLAARRLTNRAYRDTPLRGGLAQALVDVCFRLCGLPIK